MMKKQENKAIGFREGLAIQEADSLLDQMIPIPQLRPYDILVEVLAVSVNPVDSKLRQTTSLSEQLHILGFDGVGKVCELGKSATKFTRGDIIFYAGTTKRAGSNQAFQAVDERIAAIVPKNLTIEACAALPLTALTAYELLFEKFGLIPEKNANQGQSILVINGAGGVGSIVNQLAHWAGLTVFSTASPKNFSWLKKMKVDVPLDYHLSLSETLRQQQVTGIDYFAALHDCVPYFEDISKVIRPFGHLGTIVETKEVIPIHRLKNKSVSFDWEYMFTKTDYGYAIESQGEILAQIAALLTEGELESTLTKAYTTGINAKNLKQATAEVESGHSRGKIVVSGAFNGKI